METVTPETEAESVTIETDGTTIIRDWVCVDFARKLERERDRLQDAIRAYQKTDGLYPTAREAALRRIYSLLPENAGVLAHADEKLSDQ